MGADAGCCIAVFAEVTKPFRDLRARVHRRLSTSFRQILLYTALKILAIRKVCLQIFALSAKKFARKSAYISYEHKLLFHLESVFDVSDSRISGYTGAILEFQVTMREPACAIAASRLFLVISGKKSYSINPLSFSRISRSVPLTFRRTIRSSFFSMKDSFSSVMGFLSMA